MNRYWVLAVSIMVASYASADIYKWVDTSGRVHFGDSFATETKKQTKVKAEKINIVPPPYINNKAPVNTAVPITQNHTSHDNISPNDTSGPGQSAALPTAPETKNDLPKNEGAAMMPPSSITPPPKTVPIDGVPAQ